MRIDVDTCRDPDLLAAEVRRLRAVIADHTPDSQATPGEGTSQGVCTLTDAERQAVAVVIGDCGRDVAITLWGLLERTKTV